MVGRPLVLMPIFNQARRQDNQPFRLFNGRDEPPDLKNFVMA